MTATDLWDRFEGLGARCRADPEFCLASRSWTGGFRFEAGDLQTNLLLADGEIVEGEARTGEAGVICLSASEAIWQSLTAQKPPRFFNDFANVAATGALIVEGDPVCQAQYYAAVARAIELLRDPLPQPALAKVRSGSFGAPVGNYVTIAVDGTDYRVYFEEAGAGIPLLLQHTAGCHGSQWRHLMECRAITDNFRLIAYDLPFHGKSLPPVGPRWWEEQYRLRGGFLRSFVLAFAQALELDRPAFMGCSVGGMLALDLAHAHPEAFRAVISLEGGLKVDADVESLGTLWHPQVSNEYKARLMNALMSPTSPDAYRKETSMVYAAGWPPAFLGDLHYYMADYDLRGKAGDIDTRRVGVHILSGEYDASGTMEMGRQAHEAIAGSTFTPMNDVGHFPMSENPDAFIPYLLPVLENIRTG